MNLKEILRFCDDYLQTFLFKDYCPNGLQIAGKQQVNKIVTGVTACEKLIDKAIQQNADMLLVHHGYFWNGENPRIINLKYNRIKKLLTHDISLVAYHLPLDAHAEVGNNVQLAQRLNIDVTDRFDTGYEPSIGYVGQLAKAMKATEFADIIQQKLQRTPLHIPANNRKISTIAWCTGAAQDFIEQANAYGADAYLSGEISERTTHIARELGIHYFAAGHHATERYGIQALGEKLAHQFGIKHQFIDVDNPV